MYSYLLVQFFVYVKMSLAVTVLLTSALKQFGGITLQLMFWHILYTWLCIYMLLFVCVFSSTQKWMFKWGWQHSCIVLVFLFADTPCSPFLKLALSAILCIKHMGGKREVWNITESSIIKGEEQLFLTPGKKKKELYKKQVYQWWLLKGGTRQGNTVKNDHSNVLM